VIISEVKIYSLVFFRDLMIRPARREPPRRGYALLCLSPVRFVNAIMKDASEINRGGRPDNGNHAILLEIQPGTEINEIL
jgi:hypothetical protein